MSWLYSRALVEEFLEANSLDGEQYVQLNGNPIPQAYCAPDKMTDFSRLSRFGMTYKPLTEDRGEELLTWYLEGFPAKIFPLPEKAQELTENDQECGEKWRASFTKYDPSSCSWKTHQCSLLGDLDEFLVTWPQWGLMRDGECWEQRTLEQTIRGTESGLSEKLPTPTAHNAKECNSPSEQNRNTPTLATHAGGKLNPDWVEWLMNWPIKWSDLNGFNKQEFQRWQKASATAVQRFREVRTVWWDSDPSQTSHGQQPFQQSKEQHCNSLPEMPRDITRQREMERSHERSNLPLLRNNIYISKSQGKDLQSGMREQTCMDETQIVPRIGGTGIATSDRLKAIGNGQVPLCAATAWRILSD
jgi:hypothetical protein